MGEALRTVLLVGLFSLFLCPEMPAQELLWERVGTKMLTWFAGPTVLVGDVNRDGYRDLLTEVVVSVDRRTSTTRVQLWTLSGKDGRTLRVRPAVGLRRQFDQIAYAGDVDGDGVGDYAVSIIQPPQPTILELRSGKDDRLIWKVVGGGVDAMLGDLDLDGDGRPDLVVTTTVPLQVGRKGEVRAYSSRGKLLYKTGGTAQLELGAWQVNEPIGLVGDLDKDGTDDFVVGAFDLVRYRGAAAVLSGKTGKILVVGFDVKPGDRIGQACDGCGDMDGDGVPDFVAGGGTFGMPVVTAFSGKTGKAIHTWRSTLPSSDLGKVVKSAGIDVDRDGVPDVIAGAPLERRYPQAGGAFYVFSGRDGSVIFRQDAKGGGTYLGEHLAIIGVQPGSAFPLYAVQEPDFGDGMPRFSYQGRLLVYRGSPGGVEVFGSSCRGTLPTYPKLGIRDLGQKGARVTLHDAAPGAPAVFLVGLSRSRWGNLNFAPAAVPSRLPWLHALHLGGGPTGDDHGKYRYLKRLCVRRPPSSALKDRQAHTARAVVVAGQCQAGARWRLRRRPVALALAQRSPLKV